MIFHSYVKHHQSLSGMIRMIPQKRTDFFWRLKKLDMFLPPTDAFSSLGSSNLNPKKKWWETLAVLAPKHLQSSWSPSCFWTILNWAICVGICWDIPVYYPHLRWSSLSLSGYAPAWAAMWARLAAFLGADLWVLTLVSQLVLPWCSKKPI